MFRQLYSLRFFHEGVNDSYSESDASFPNVMNFLQRNGSPDWPNVAKVLSVAIVFDIGENHSQFLHMHQCSVGIVQVSNPSAISEAET